MNARGLKLSVLLINVLISLSMGQGLKEELTLKTESSNSIGDDAITNEWLYFEKMNDTGRIPLFFHQCLETKTAQQVSMATEIIKDSIILFRKSSETMPRKVIIATEHCYQKAGEKAFQEINIHHLVLDSITIRSSKGFSYYYRPEVTVDKIQISSHVIRVKALSYKYLWVSFALLDGNVINKVYQPLENRIPHNGVILLGSIPESSAVASVSMW